MRQKILDLIILVILFGNLSCQWNLDTLAPTFDCGRLYLDTRDGQEYETVQIGTQCWFAENLNIGTRINTSIGQAPNNIIEKYCYNDQDSMCAKYGGMYRPDEIIQTLERDSSGNVIQPSDTFFYQGICPDGWHIPSDEEWGQLEFEIGISLDSIPLNEAWRGKSVFAANKLKKNDPDCASPTTHCGDSEFNALLAGSVNGDFATNEGILTAWYTSTVQNQEPSQLAFWARRIDKDNHGILKRQSNLNGALYLRCVQNPL